MKYLKLYEEFDFKKGLKRISKLFEGDTVLDIIKKQYPDKGKWFDIRFFECDVRDLTSLEGIGVLENLVELHCQGNKLKSLEGIEKLKNLEILRCGSNNLTSLEMGEFSLDAIEIGIDKTDLSRFPKLSFLSCGNNKFPMEYSIFLKKYCKENKIDLYDGID